MLKRTKSEERNFSFTNNQSSCLLFSLIISFHRSETRERALREEHEFHRLLVRFFTCSMCAPVGFEPGKSSQIWIGDFESLLVKTSIINFILLPSTSSLSSLKALSPKSKVYIRE